MNHYTLITSFLLVIPEKQILFSIDSNCFFQNTCTKISPKLFFHYGEGSMPIPNTDIESELSYAYLHSVASHAGMTCTLSTRLVDSMRIDASIRAKGLFAQESILRDIALDIQLKATVASPVTNNSRISYHFRGIDAYDNLRDPLLAVPKILVVLFLPEKQNEWLTWTPENLCLKKCAWWVSLKGAAGTKNSDGVTVYLPEGQYFNCDALKDIVCKLSKQEELLYGE